MLFLTAMFYNLHRTLLCSLQQAKPESAKCHCLLPTIPMASTARESHTRRASSGMLEEGSAETVRTVLSPVRDTFDRRLFRTPLQLLGILNAHLLW